MPVTAELTFQQIRKQVRMDNKKQKIAEVFIVFHCLEFQETGSEYLSP